MRLTSHAVSLFVVLSCAITACGDDGGAVDRTSRPALCSTIGIDVGTVASFAFVSSGGPGSATGPIRKAPDGGVEGDVGSLYALTLSGETIEVSLVEETNPDARGSVRSPRIEEVFSTPTWILFRTLDYVLDRVGADGGAESVACNTILARRSDGALFCTEFRGRPTTHGLDFSLQTNAAGDVVYLEGGSPATNDSRVYRVSLGAADGPSAIGLTPPVALPGWFYSNADGDLLHVYTPSPLDPSTKELAIFPADGSAPISLGTRAAGAAMHGALGAADQNTFYALVGGGDGIQFAGSIRVFTKQGAGFVETEVSPNLPMVTNYGILLGLADGVYLFSPLDHALARIFADGVLVANPVPVTITGVDSFLGVNGVNVSPVAGRVLFLANTASGVQFIRHDGTTQTNIPVPADLTLTRVIFAQSGAVDLLAVRTSTLESVRGSIEPNATAVTLETTGVLDPDRIVTFTRIR